MSVRRRNVAALLAGAALPPIAGCAWVGPQTAALRAAPPADLPPRVEWPAVPFVAQLPLHCGPAALAMVLQHLGRRVGADVLADEVFLPARAGTLQAEMLAGARRHDGFAVVIAPTLQALLHELAAGHPVVMLQNLGLAIAPQWHYAVAIGYELADETVILRSGLDERVAMHWRTFEHTWARSGHWAFVVLAPGQLATAADEASTAAAAAAFERVASPASALRVYDALLVRWPGNLVAAIGAGNARVAAGDVDGALRAFEAAAARHDSAAAWNNLALLRWRRGDAAGARAALANAERRVAGADAAFADAVRATRATIGP
ncbi:MAG: PA2778 family cysteine peptidase [Burkholderiaceae bacterium]